MSHCHHCEMFAGVGASKCPSCERWLDGYESDDEPREASTRPVLQLVRTDAARASARANHPAAIGVGGQARRRPLYHTFQINNAGKTTRYLVRASTDASARSRLLSYLDGAGLALMSQGKSARRISAFRSAEARRALLICGTPAPELPTDRALTRVADGVYLEQRG